MLTYLFPSFLVAIYAAGRFNTPRTNRATTDRTQFFLSGTAYVGASLLLYAAIASLLVTNPSISKLLFFGTDLPQTALELAGPLLAALVMTTLLPRVPLIQDVDAKIIRFFQKMGSIPLGAIRLADGMLSAGWRPPPGMEQEIRDFIRTNTAIPDALLEELRFDSSDDSTRFRFTRNLALYLGILRNRELFSAFLAEFPPEKEEFDKNYKHFLTESAGFFVMTRQIEAQHLDQVPDSILEARARFHEHCLDLYERLRLFVAQGLLFGSDSQATARRQLRQLGFALQPYQAVKVPLNKMGWLAMVTACCFAAPAAVFDTRRLSVTLAIALLVAVSYSAAAIFAILPKQIWEFADARTSGERPLIGYLASAIATLLIAIPLNFVLGFWLAGTNWDGVLAVATFGLKWQTMSAILAFALAFACDDWVSDAPEPGWLRWAEGALTAVLLAGAGFFIKQHLVGVPPEPIRPSGDELPSYAMPLAMVVIGAAFGAIIPSWYRAKVRRANVAQPLAPASLAAPTGLAAPSR